MSSLKPSSVCQHTDLAVCLFHIYIHFFPFSCTISHMNNT